MMFRAKHADLISDATFSEIVSMLSNEKTTHRQLFDKKCKEIRDGQKMSELAFGGTPCLTGKARMTDTKILRL